MKKLTRIFAVFMVIATLFAFGGCTAVEVKGEVYKMEQIFLQSEGTEIECYTTKTFRPGTADEQDYWASEKYYEEANGWNKVCNEFNVYSSVKFCVNGELVSSENNLLTIALYVQTEESANMNFALVSGLHTGVPGASSGYGQKRLLVQSKTTTQAGTTSVILFQINKPMTEILQNAGSTFPLYVEEVEYKKITEENPAPEYTISSLGHGYEHYMDGKYYMTASNPTVKWKIVSVEFVIDKVEA